MIRARLDFASCRIDLSGAPSSPTVAAAVKTPEGYLDVDAYLARDGCLRYSDGVTAWNEYRPRSELERAADSFANVYITDDHPPVMLDATNATQYQRGIVLGRPTLETIGGVTYLRARISIRDAALIEKIESGQTQLSIGFWSDVESRKGIAPDGTRYDAVQNSLRGNHVASVAKGRAGPAVRVFMDSRERFAWTGFGCDVCGFGTVEDCDAFSPRAPCPECGTVHLLDSQHKPRHASFRMRKLTVPATLKLALASLERWRTDEAGIPTTQAKIVGPDGTELEVPTWLAALVEDAIAMKAEAEKAKAPPAESEASPAEETPAAEAAEAPAPAPEDEEKQEEPPMTKDQIDALVAAAVGPAARKRARLERLASDHKVDRAKLDADDTELARAFVAKVLSVESDKLEGAALDALVEVAAKVPAPKPENPFEQRREISTAGDDDYERQAKILRANGVQV